MRVLGWAPPRYAHLPIAVDATGTKLSKQTGADAVSEAQPVATLCAVLRFLNQETPADLQHASLEQFWAHAIANWNLARVGTRRQAPALGRP
jgi:glutamyl-Q tRNA(Asp) synthetase